MGVTQGLLLHCVECFYIDVNSFFLFFVLVFFQSLSYSSFLCTKTPKLCVLCMTSQDTFLTSNLDFNLRP